MFNKFKKLEGELYTAEVHHIRHKAIILLDDDGNEIIMPRDMQIPSDFFRKGDNVRGVIEKVEMIGIKPSVERFYLDEEEKIFNNSIKLLASEDAYLEYIDVWDSMLSEDGSRMPELYIEDGLHMNKKGYEVWTKQVRKSLSKDFNI